MKRAFSVEQIIEMIEQNQAGTDVIQLCKDNHVGVSTFYRWKAKYKGLNSQGLAHIRHLQAEKIKELEEETRKLKKALQQAETDVANLRDLLSKNW